MIRRLVRILVSGFCLLSLLAALGTTRLWGEYRHGRGYQVDASVGRAFVTLASQTADRRMGILILSDWPGRASLHIWPQKVADEHRPYWWDVRLRSWHRFHVIGQSGTGVVYV